MAKNPKVKITYTYNGTTFTTGSQRVAKAAASGHMDVAYRRYLSDTVGRQLRSLDRLSKANRLQYLSNADKLNAVTQLGDRGLATRNELREILNLEPLPEDIGNQIPARGEYYDVKNPPEKKVGSGGGTEGGKEDAGEN